MPQQVLLGFTDVGNCLGEESIARDHGLRERAFGFLFGEPSKIRCHRVKPGIVEFAAEGTRLREPDHDFINDLTQADFIWQRQLHEFNQSAQLWRDGECWRSDHDGSAIGRKFLPNIPETPHYHRIFDMAMKILKDKNSFDGQRFQISKRLRRFLAVIERGSSSRVGAVNRAWKGGARKAMFWYHDVTRTANQASGDTPLEYRKVQRRCSRTYQPDGTHLLGRLHHNDGGRRINEDFQPFEDVWHGCLS